MKKIILLCDEIRKIEEEIEKKCGISRLILMKNAGCGSKGVLNLNKNRKWKIGIFCRKGNNGGDGFVSAKYLFNRDFEVEVYYFG